MNYNKIHKFYLKLMLAGCTCTSSLTAQKNNETGIPFANNFSGGIIYSTTKGTDERISQTATLNFVPYAQPLETDVCIFVDPSHQFQSIVGFGGALTDASAEVFAKLPKAAQDSIINAYYDSTSGIGYTFGRTNIGSCDFSSDSYSYVNDNDVSLRSFSVKHDEQYRIPLIKNVNKKLNGKLTLFASPWSPPAWMKDNNDLLHGGKLKKEYYQTWANYFVKFIQAYKVAGINIWGVTVQNEPMAKQIWESCNYSAEDERDFVKNALGPAFEKNNLSDKKIIVWDHNRDLAYQYASTILNDPQAAKYVWGVGLHWYETWTKSEPLFDNVKNLHEAFPDVNLLFTEGCKENFDFNNINDWRLGELYGNNILNDLNNGIRAWSDWNILLDQNGGPNHVHNYCYAPVIGDVNTGKIYFTNEYWYIGQFAKFIRPGARRIISSSNRNVLQTTAFLNKDGKIAIVVLNTGDQNIEYNLWIKQHCAKAVSKAHSIETIII
ncbi:MAG: glycoside hydrolase family 30 protein [Arachidicoccus sp.]|nr:glycoside hydrolase family 30 protein [Arachidicoccus sp.]